ncbi:MAG: hypothetical protein KC506_00300, partial [Nanoarchaeota archaeon]|nr:hypothetical protein [Nanoarchaeota archaeon]
MKKEAILLTFALLVVQVSLVSADFAPKIGELDSEFIVCESTQFSQRFTATDLDGNALIPDVSPKVPFYTRVVSTDPQKTVIERYSTNLTKEFADKIFETTVSVSDGTYIDSKKVTFKTFETNNKPSINPISATTISLDRSPKLTKQVYAT